MTTITLDFKASVDQAGKDIKGLAGVVGKFSKAINEDANGALKTFGVDLTALNNPMTAVAQGMKAAIDETVKWAGDIDKLARNTGLSATEASKLAIVAGDVGIEIGTLERALKSMTKDGLELNIDSLKDLSKQYNALKSPVDRMAFATDHFGAAAQDMTEILSRSSKELDALAEAAERSGKVMDEEAIASAEKFEQSLAQLDDMVKGAQVSIGNVLIPTLLTAGEAFQTQFKIVSVLAIEFQRLTGQIDYNEASQRAAAVAAGDLGAAFEEQYPIVGDVADAHDRAASTTETLTADQILLNAQTAAMTSTWQTYSPTVSDAAAKNMEYQQTLAPLTGATSDLAFGMSELTDRLIFNAAAAGMSDDAALALAVSMGLVDEKTLAVKNQLDAALEQYDENHDGLISLAESANGYADAVLRITGNLQAAVAAQAQLNALANGAGQSAGGGVVAGGSGGYAEGTPGIMTVPQGYPNDSFSVSMQSGEQFAVAPAGQSLMDWLGGGGGQTNNFYISNPNPSAVAAEVSRVLASQARQYKASGAGAALGSR